MTISSISTGLSPSLSGTAGRFFLPGAAEFADKLTLGQILKGRVLRQYEGNRYLVDFEGHERVVDSAVPLTTGELLHGRVIGLGERVELQRMPNPESGSGERFASSQFNAMPVPSSVSGDPLAATLARFQVNLGPAEQAVLMRAVQNAADGSAMAIAGVALNKLGLPQSPELLKAVYDMLLSRQVSVGDQSAIDMQPLIQGAAESVIPPAVLVMQLGEMLRQTLEESIPRMPDTGESPAAAGAAELSIHDGEQARNGAMNGDTGSRDSGLSLGQWVLNAQTDGSVAHRAGTIPLLVGNRLMEVEVALFEQRKNAQAQSDTRHRHLVFRLNTESMGTVEISARLAGDRVRVSVVSEDENAATVLAGETQSLRAALSEAGWKVDEVAYETKASGPRNAAAHAVVEHVINQDSLNRLA